MGCGRDLPPGPVASISGGVMGDECTESWYLCPDCAAYTVEVCHDRFLGEEAVSVRGPVPDTEGRPLVDLIGRCARPWDKTCRCEAHRAYFGDSLD